MRNLPLLGSNELFVDSFDKSTSGGDGAGMCPLHSDCSRHERAAAQRQPDPRLHMARWSDRHINGNDGERGGPEQEWRGVPLDTADHYSRYRDCAREG